MLLLAPKGLGIPLCRVYREDLQSRTVLTHLLLRMPQNQLIHREDLLTHLLLRMPQNQLITHEGDTTVWEDSEQAHVNTCIQPPHSL